MSHAKKHFPTYLSVSNAMLLNNLIHQVLVLVLQHPRRLSLNLLLCVWINSQNVKHLLQWITGTSWHFGKKHRRFPTVPKALMRSSLFARSWFRHPGSSSSQHRSSLFCQYSPSSPTLGASTCGLVFVLVFAWVGCCHFWFILKLKPLLRNTILWNKNTNATSSIMLEHNMGWKITKTKRKHIRSGNGVSGKKRCYCVCLRILLNAVEWRWTVFSHFYKIIASVKAISPTPLHFGKQTSSVTRKVLTRSEDFSHSLTSSDFCNRLPFWIGNRKITCHRRKFYKTRIQGWYV